MIPLRRKGRPRRTARTELVVTRSEVFGMSAQTLKATMLFDEALAAAQQGLITPETAATLIRAQAGEELESLLAVAVELRDRVKGRHITYSKKVFIPLTNLC